MIFFEEKNPAFSQAVPYNHFPIQTTVQPFILLTSLEHLVMIVICACKLQIVCSDKEML